MMTIRLLAGTLCLALAPVVAAAEAAEAALIARMQEGGTVIYLRHAVTDHSQIDTGRLGHRSGQRNLSEVGRVQARALGTAFSELGIAFSRILASPVFRARDTAELAFGPERVEVTMDLVADDYAGSELGRMLTATGRLLGTKPPEGRNLLLVGHRTPLAMVTGQSFPDSILPEGAMAVFEPEGNVYRLLGTVSPEALIAAAE